MNHQQKVALIATGATWVGALALVLAFVAYGMYQSPNALEFYIFAGMILALFVTLVVGGAGAIVWAILGRADHDRR